MYIVIQFTFFIWLSRQCVTFFIFVRFLFFFCGHLPFGTFSDLFFRSELANQQIHRSYERVNKSYKETRIKTLGGNLIHFKLSFSIAQKSKTAKIVSKFLLKFQCSLFGEFWVFRTREHF